MGCQLPHWGAKGLSYDIALRGEFFCKSVGMALDNVVYS